MKCESARLTLVGFPHVVSSIFFASAWEIAVGLGVLAAVDGWIVIHRLCIEVFMVARKLWMCEWIGIGYSDVWLGSSGK